MAKISYEVHVRREGRWTIEASFENQNAAEALARAELTARGAEEVKVLKYRPFAGFEVEVAVYHLKAPEMNAIPMGLCGGPEGAPFCEKLGDLYCFESRRVISRLLRRFLDRFSITASELLHGWTYARKLDDQGTLLRAAISSVARHQAEATGSDPKERARQLTGFAERALVRLREFDQERERLPRLVWNDMERSSRQLGLAVGEEVHNFYFLCQLTEELLSRLGPIAKLDHLMEPWEECADPRVAALLEGVVADIVGSVAALRELLGDQPNLAGGLTTLADHLSGRPPALGDVPVNPLLTRLARMIVEGRAPVCQFVLVDRIATALAGAQPLDRRDPKAEAVLLSQVRERLRGPDGALLGGATMAHALDGRAARHRQKMLRAIGMDDVADQVTPSRS